ncbi:hypothetical protein P0M11_12520 [Kaistella sp. PBT33-4]|uniref:hypothetical protein n=1 Tax=Kaistella sp. PBT33-4 TaxID=3032000 RepID=UPI0023D8A65D|nr:hypothetical protein [Kaistella sp. PBT33-4]MDF0720824.1 hypothetical protein [Kaistella sp. PBT33-4]
MGKFHTLFTISGKVGGYVYYLLNGKQVVRKAAGKRKGPKTQGEEERVLYNTEFGRASAAGKVLRQALAEELLKLNDRYLYQRVNRLILQLRSFDPWAPGERTAAGGLDTEDGQALLAGFHFHKKYAAFPKILRATRKGTQLRVEVSEVSPRPTEMLEVQINFNKGIFRKHSHSYPDGIAVREVIVKRQFRSRKGFTDLVMISGDAFLQGVVISESY